MKELKQQYLLTKKEFYLTDIGIKVISKTVSENLEYTIRYDELGFDIIKKREKTAMIPAILLSLFFLLELYLFFEALYNEDRIALILMWLGSAVLFGLLAGLAFYQTNKDVVYLTGGSKVLELLRNKPSEEAVDNFVWVVHERIRAFYKSKFAVVDKHLPQEVQVERLRWLKDSGIINQAEHEELILQLQNNYLF